MTIEIENGITPPADETPPQTAPKKRSRARKQAAGGSGKKTANPAASLIAALNFIAVAQKKAGPTNIQFSHLTHHWAAACDGVLTVAHPIEEDLSACPNTLQFIEALSKAGDELSITQLTPNALAIASGAFRGLVPCVGFDEVPIPAPDPQCAVIDDRIKTALASVAGLATEGAQNAAYAAVLLQAGVAVATNGAALLEYWHGIDLPPGMLIPKLSAQAIAKAKKPLTGFGFSESSATFWFEDGSFIKTQLFGERFPNYQIIFPNEEPNFWPVPEEFFKGVRAIEAFSQNGHIYFSDGAVSSRLSKEEASTYKIEGLPERMGFSVKLLLVVEHAFKSAFFNHETNRVIFIGENMRGVVMGLDVAKEAPPLQNDNSYLDDDIPF